MLITADWPLLDGLVDERAGQELEWVIQFVSEVRSVRAEMNVPAGAKIPVIVAGANDETTRRIERYGETVKRLARIDNIELGEDVPKGSIQIVLNEAMVVLPLEGIIDFSAESARLEREIEKVGSEIDKLSSKLGNTKFISRAPEHVIEEQRERKADAEATAQRLKQALKRLEATL
jgi:valyl-tRNA synthetase